MRIILMIIACVVLFTTTAMADWEIKPKYYDFTPNDGFMDKGTIFNPYVIEDSWGNTKGTIEPKYYDFTPNDGFMDAGTQFNPYKIDWK